MNYLAVWKILEEMIVELRKKGVQTPKNVMNDLKSAKVLLKIMDASERDQGEATSRIEMYFGSLEAYLVTKATKEFNSKKVDSWLRRLKEARCKVYEISKGKEKLENKFVKGVPRDQNWIRIEPLTTLPLEKLLELAEKGQLSSHLEEDGRLLVYGKGEDLREFVKKMTELAAKK